MKNAIGSSKLAGFAEHIVQIGLISEEIADQAVQQATLSDMPLINYLSLKKIAEPKRIALEAASYYRLPLFDLDSLDNTTIPFDLLNIAIVQKGYALPFYRYEGRLFLAVSDPTVINISEINFLTGLNAQLVIVEAAKLLRKLESVSSAAISSELTKNSAANIDLNIEEVDVAIDAESNDSPVVRFLNKLLQDAFSKKVSDIHFEPFDKIYRIRYRQDGILYEVASPSKKLSNYIVARLKIMADLDIAEHRVPQDGRFELNLGLQRRLVDFRMSTCPTLHGEKVVLRILNSSTELLDVDALGLDKQQKELFLKNINRPQGMILVTGPTGSGKTVTLYTALNTINTIDKNIYTVEDPIEIQLHGINQVAMNLKTGLSFSTALRSFLRQDPDVIMVGEIRDTETAEIAVRAAQTGHLVLSTLHTNSASETLIRLANMGIQPFNIASSITLIIAQRLARKLCVLCKQPEQIPTEILLREGFKQEDINDLTVYRPNGCERCTNGYSGRIALFEVMPITADMARLILANGTAIEINELACKEGMLTLRQTGLAKVKEGVTSLEEITRVVHQNG